MPTDHFVNQISIHALREEGDQRCNSTMHPDPISIHALREEGDPMSGAWSLMQISIHALREEGDVITACLQECYLIISIHALREEGDHRLRRAVRRNKVFLSTPSARRATRGLRQNSLLCTFLSTPSARRATRCFTSGTYHVHDFYPRPPRGGRHLSRNARNGYKNISIHALREEGDSKNRDKISIFKQIIQHSARI